MVSKSATGSRSKSSSEGVLFYYHTCIPFCALCIPTTFKNWCWVTTHNQVKTRFSNLHSVSDSDTTTFKDTNGKIRIPFSKDTNWKIRTIEFIYICGSKNGYRNSACKLKQYFQIFTLCQIQILQLLKTLMER